ncbi:MAG TPA: hypothetical protein PLX84_15535 [Acidiphilium sp.]|nr:hypothetical protein [Acidiphilium sp.]
MRPVQFQADSLAKLLKTQKTATLEELKRALGTRVTVTVFRKLKTLAYRSSYSHRGRYYTLNEVARFDERGLWEFRGIYFSRLGTLLATAEAFVRACENGYFVNELKKELGVGVKDALATLVKRDQIAREQVSGRFLYCSPDPAVRRRQIISRRAKEMEQTPEEARMTDKVKAAIVLFLSLLDEQQRRIYAGLEALKVGRGGDRWVAELLELDPATVARGRQELLAGKVLVDRTRKSGGGRKAHEKKRQG